MAKKILLGTLTLALLLELVLTVGAFVPGSLFGLFKISTNSDTLFLVHLVAWFLVVIDVLCGVAIWKVRQGDPLGWTVASSVAVWWVCLGVSVFVFFGRPDNLLLDSLKGIIILISARLSRPGST